tara:strand:+ start:1828 stop:2082 length:255 start_codon:yes stop_codon:yes gene_type:complete
VVFLSRVLLLIKTSQSSENNSSQRLKSLSLYALSKLFALRDNLSLSFTTAVPYGFCFEQEKIIADKKRIDNIFFILINFMVYKQ